MLLIVLILILTLSIGYLVTRVEQSGFKNSDLINSHNDRELFIERYKGKKVELKRIREVQRLSGKGATVRRRTVSLNAPMPTHSNYVSVGDYLQIVEINRLIDKVIFTIAYSGSDMDKIISLLDAL